MKVDKKIFGSLTKKCLGSYACTKVKEASVTSILFVGKRIL